MSAGPIALEIVTPDGVALVERGLEAVIFHRREPRFEVGSEIAVLPQHAPMLVRLPISPMRFSRGEDTVHLAVGGGFAEVLRDHVLVLTPRCERIDAHGGDARVAALERCARWRSERLGPAPREAPSG